MKKNIKLILSLIIGLVLPLVSSAVSFSNPANGFLIDLTSFGQPNTFRGLLVYLINITVGVVTVLSVAFIIYGGFLYVTSRGDEEQAETGKKTLTNAIIGLIVVIISYTVVTVIINALKTGSP